MLPFGANIFYTTNSGINWIQSYCPPEIRAIAGVQYINANTIYACGAENIMKLPGLNYIRKIPSSLPFYMQKDQYMLGINGSDAEYKGAFLKSTNSGLNWQKVSQFDTATGYLLDLYFFDANTGFVCADSGNYGNTSVLKTINGGVNWQKIYLDSNLSLSKIKFININTGFVSGNTGDLFNSGYGVIFRTTNSGVNWIKTNFPYTQRIQDFSFANSTTGIAVGNSGTGGWVGTKIFRTTNSGLNWDSLSFSISDVVPYFVSFVTGSGTALISGFKMIDTFDIQTVTIKTTDYGNN